MERLTESDNLTGLANRNGFAVCFQNSVNNHIEKRQQLSLLLLNLDGFEQINKQFGEQSGDLVLTSLAKILSNCISYHDQVFRYGEEKFTVILNDTCPHEIPVIVARIKKAITDNLVLSEFDVSCSIGSANYQEDDDINRLFDRAEEALSCDKIQNDSSQVLSA